MGNFDFSFSFHLSKNGSLNIEFPFLEIVFLTLFFFFRSERFGAHESARGKPVKHVTERNLPMTSSYVINIWRVLRFLLMMSSRSPSFFDDDFTLIDCVIAFPGKSWAAGIDSSPERIARRATWTRMRWAPRKHQTRKKKGKRTEEEEEDREGEEEREGESERGTFSNVSIFLFREFNNSTQSDAKSLSYNYNCPHSRDRYGWRHHYVIIWALMTSSGCSSCGFDSTACCNRKCARGNGSSSNDDVITRHTNAMMTSSLICNLFSLCSLLSPH